MAWDGDSGTSIKIAQYGVLGNLIYSTTHPLFQSQIYLETLLRERIQAPRYRISSSSAALGLQLYLLTFFSFLWEYRIEQVELEDFDAGLVVALDPGKNNSK